MEDLLINLCELPPSLRSGDMLGDEAVRTAASIIDALDRWLLDTPLGYSYATEYKLGHEDGDLFFWLLPHIRGSTVHYSVESIPDSSFALSFLHP